MTRLVAVSIGCVVLALLAAAGLAGYTATQVRGDPPAAVSAQAAYLTDRSPNVVLRDRRAGGWPCVTPPQPVG